MTVVIKNNQALNATDSADLKSHAFGNVVEADGQSYYIGPGQRMSNMNDGVAISLASYSTAANDGTVEDSGIIGSTEGWSRS